MEESEIITKELLRSCSCDRKLYMKLYNKMNREILSEKHKKYMIEYKEKNKDLIKAKQKIRNFENRDYMKKWRETNNYNQKLVEKRRLENPPKVLTEQDLIDREVLRKKKKSEYQRKYRNTNGRDITLSRRRKEKKERRLTDSVFALQERVRARISNAFVRIDSPKPKATEQILGCTFDEFKKYLESKFESWMSWDNAGKYNGELNYGWDLDHIIPMCSAKTEEDVLRLNHYSNFQPLCSYINRHVKRDKIEEYAAPTV